MKLLHVLGCFYSPKQCSCHFEWKSPQHIFVAWFPGFTSALCFFLNAIMLSYFRRPIPPMRASYFVRRIWKRGSRPCIRRGVAWGPSCWCIPTTLSATCTRPSSSPTLWTSAQGTRYGFPDSFAPSLSPCSLSATSSSSQTRDPLHQRRNLRPFHFHWRRRAVLSPALPQCPQPSSPGSRSHSRLVGTE